MQLRRVTVHNFRGIQHEELVLKDYSLLVGANNAGKSTVADALRVFYEKDGYKFRKDRDWPKVSSIDDSSYVELDFVSTAEEYEGLADEYRLGNNELTVRKYLEVGGKIAKDGYKKGAIYGKVGDDAFSDTQFYGAQNVQKGKLGELIYIPAVSKVDEHTKLSGPSALRDLLTNVLDDVVESSELFERFQQEFEQFASEVKTEETSDGRSLSRFENELSELLKPWQTSFAVEIAPPRPAEIIKNLVRYQCVDDLLGVPQNAEDFGSGFQRHFIFSLIRLAPKFVGRKPTKKAKEFSPSFTLIVFEEPEAFLHPPQQEQLATSLRKLGEENDRQVLCTTHSSNFVSRNSDDIPSIIRLQRVDGIIKSYQIESQEWSSLVDTNQTINKLPSLKNKVIPQDLEPDMEAVKYFLWLNSERSTLFFADFVLLVEGATEQTFINRLIKAGRISTGCSGIYVLDCIGKFNIHRFMSLFSRLGIRHSVIFDDDNEKEVHAEVNQLIEDSKCPLTTHFVQPIAGNLEVHLGVPPCGRPDRKPQHLMFHFDRGNIGQEELNSFCELVGECLPDNTENHTIQRLENSAESTAELQKA